MTKKCYACGTVLPKTGYSSANAVLQVDCGKSLHVMAKNYSPYQ